MVTTRTGTRARVYVAIYKLTDQIYEDALHWTLLIGPNRNDTLDSESAFTRYELLHELPGYDGKRSVHRQPASTTDLISRILIAHIRDRHSVMDALQTMCDGEDHGQIKAEARAAEVCEVSRDFVRRAVQRLAMDDVSWALADERQLDWSTIETRAIRYSLLQRGLERMAGMDEAAVPIATYDLIHEQDITAKARTLRHRSSSTASLRIAVSNFTEKLRLLT